MIGTGGGRPSRVVLAPLGCSAAQLEAGERVLWTRACKTERGDAAGSDTDISEATTIQPNIGNEFTHHGVR
jgi:hypothetical protein